MVIKFVRFHLVKNYNDLKEYKTCPPVLRTIINFLFSGGQTSPPMEV